MVLFNTCKPLIGVVHLPPLPGSPAYKRKLYPGRIGRKWRVDDIYDYALQESKKYENAGFDAIIIENYGDKPYSIKASIGQVAAMTSIVREVVSKIDIPVGVSLLRNSAYEAIYIAYTTGAKFVRINSMCEHRLSLEGLLTPTLYDVAKALSELDAFDDVETGQLAILADINVKHSWAIPGQQNPEEIAEECLTRSGFRIAGLIATGPRTGIAPNRDYIAGLKNVARKFDSALLIGSGINTENISEYWRLSDGFIVGSSVKLGGETENVVSIERAKRLADVAKRYREIWPCTKTR